QVGTERAIRAQTGFTHRFVLVPVLVLDNPDHLNVRSRTAANQRRATLEYEYRCVESEYEAVRGPRITRSRRASFCAMMSSFIPVSRRMRPDATLQCIHQIQHLCRLLGCGRNDFVASYLRVDQLQDRLTILVFVFRKIEPIL